MTQDEQEDEAPSGDGAIGAPQIAVDLPPSADGASFATWQSHLGFAGHVELIDPGDLSAFHASVRIATIKPFSFSETFVSHPLRYRRSAEDVARTGLDTLTILLHVAGSYRWTIPGGGRIAAAGDVSFIDFGEPFDIEMSTIRTLAVMVPRTLLPEAMRARALAGLVLPAPRAVTRLLATTLRACFDGLMAMTPDEAVAAGHAILTLADAASRGAAPQPASGLRPAALSLFERAQALIEERLGEAALSAETIAQALSVSRSVLYRPFTPHGGIQAYILERRLWRGYERIVDGIDPDESLRLFAARLGFSSEAHFSRAFKQRFGLGPRAMRALARNRSLNIMPSRVPGLASDVIRTLGA